MYKVMVVDDDELVRGRVKSLLPMEKLGIELCGEASTGPEALELFEQQHPQIVIMDINIPVIDGLEATKRIVAGNPEANVIILTGYGSVENAKAAIKSGAVDFLLKPVDAKELEDTVRRITDGLQDRYQRALERRRMEQMLKEEMPFIRNRYFTSLMTLPHKGLTEEECRRYLQNFGISGEARNICIAVLCPNYSCFSLNDQMPIQAALEEELGKVLKPAGVSDIVLYDSIQDAIVVAYGDSDRLDNLLEQKLSALRDLMRYVYRLDFSAGIGCVVNGFSSLSESYRAAIAAIDSGNIYSDSKIVSSCNIRDDEVPQRRALKTMSYADVVKLFVANDPGKTEDALREYFNRLVYESEGAFDIVCRMGIEIVALFLSAAQEVGGNTEVAFSGGAAPFVKIMHAGSVSEIWKTIMDVVNALSNDVQDQKKKHTNRAVDSAKLYIRRQYADPELSLEKTAESVSLSPAYLSSFSARRRAAGLPITSTA